MNLRSIEEVPCHCTVCVWSGVTGDCTDNADDGELVCPACGAELVIEYSAQERGFWPDKESPALNRKSCCTHSLINQRTAEKWMVEGHTNCTCPLCCPDKWAINAAIAQKGMALTGQFLSPRTDDGQGVTEQPPSKRAVAGSNPACGSTSDRGTERGPDFQPNSDETYSPDRGAE